MEYPKLARWLISWKIPINRWMIWGYPFFWKPPFRPRNHEFSVRGSILKHVLSVSNLSPRAHSGARWASGSLALLVTWHGAVTMKFSPIGRVSQRRFVYFQLTRPTRPDSLQNVVKQKVLSLSITIPLFYPFFALQLATKI